MKKRLLGLIFILAALCAVLTVSVSAAENENSGVCGDDLTWTLYDYSEDHSLTLVISGTGPMTEFNNLNPPPWSSRRNSIKTVIIGSEVTSIGCRAFEYCQLTTISIPGSVT